MLKYAFFVSLLTGPLCLPVQAKDSWICTYADEDNKTKITKFEVVSDELIQGGAAVTKYKILQNNDVAIVAAYSLAEIYQPNQPVIGALIVLINKQDNTLVLSGATTYMNFTPQKGTCIVN